MIRYKIYQNKQKTGLGAGKWFARSVSDETFDLDKLSAHMSSHNTPYSAGVIRGVLTDMVKCIKELLLDGKSVKIDDLAIFGVGIRCKGADSIDNFSLEKNITGMRLKARATGNLSTTNLKLASQLKQMVSYNRPESSASSSPVAETPTPAQPADPSPKGDEPGVKPKEPTAGVEKTDQPKDPKETGGSVSPEI